MLVIGLAVFLSAVAICFALLWFRSPTEAPVQYKESSILPSVGQTVAGRVSQGREHIRVYFKVEERKESKLMLQILSELGNTRLLGIRPGTMGELDVGSHHFPIRVKEARLPWIEVETFLREAKPVHRQAARLPVTFSVRFRRQGAAGQWSIGESIDISAGGLCFFSNSLVPLQVGSVYQVEIAVSTPRGKGEMLAFAAEVQWVQPCTGGSIAGLKVFERNEQRELARLVAQLAGQLARRPKDYLSEVESKRPDLG